MSAMSLRRLQINATAPSGVFHCRRATRTARRGRCHDYGRSVFLFHPDNRRHYERLESRVLRILGNTLCIASFHLNTLLYQARRCRWFVSSHDDVAGVYATLVRSPALNTRMRYQAASRAAPLLLSLSAAGGIRRVMRIAAKLLTRLRYRYILTGTAAHSRHPVPHYHSSLASSPPRSCPLHGGTARLTT